MNRLPRWFVPALAAVPAIVLVVFYAWPFVTVLGRGLSRTALAETLGDATTWDVVWFTLWQALVSTALTVVIGLAPAYVIARFDFPGRRLLDSALVAVFVLPTVVIGAAVLAVLPASIERGVAAIVVAHVLFNLAVVVRTVGAVLSTLPRDREAAAATLGASPRRVFREIVVPAILPAIGAAAAIVFVFTFTSFGVVRILGSVRNSTIEVEIWRQATRFGDIGSAATLTVIQLVAIVALVGVSAALQQRRSRPLGLTVGHQRQPPRRGRQRRLVAVTAVLSAIVIAVPMAALVERSLRTGDGYSLGAWRNLGSTEVRPGIAIGIDPVDALVTSLQVMVVAVVLAVVVGGVAALAIAAATTGGKVLDTALMLPIATSAVTIGFGILITFDEDPVDWRGSWLIVPVGQALVAIPFVVRTVLPVLRGVEGRRLEAAATLGASPLRAWRASRASAPAPPACRRRGSGGGDLARRVRGDELPVAERRRDDADRHRAVARPHRHAAPGSGLRPRRDPRRGDDRRRARPRHHLIAFPRTRGRRMSELIVDDVVVAFAGHTVLDGATLTVTAGEVVALLGPSGSGKSTLLRVIAGLVAPQRGTVRIGGGDVTDIPTHRRGVGMVFQDEQLFEHLDVAGNVAFGLRMRGDPAANRQQRSSELLALVGLAGFEHRNVRQLSGGEAKRVALARSLAPSPNVLLLDEPLTGLDRELHDRLADDLAAILRAEQTTSLIVTHDHDEAAAIADRVVTVDELLDNPS